MALWWAMIRSADRCGRFEVVWPSDGTIVGWPRPSALRIVVSTQ